ncbi:hypothetical protein AeNC1_019325, partial [Aphanomyces euteiches]
HLLVWIDDILVYANDPEEYTKVLDQFFDLVSQYGFKLSPTKTKLYTKQVKWCGRYLSESGVKQDPERIQALCAIPVPTNAGELQCLTRALDGKSKKKRIASGIQICLTDDEVKAFEAVKTKLRSAIELAHPRDDATTCLFTDASDTGWPIIVTQVLGFDADVPIQDQQHQMLVCQSGMFTGAQLN